MVGVEERRIRWTESKENKLSRNKKCEKKGGCNKEKMELVKGGTEDEYLKVANMVK